MFMVVVAEFLKLKFVTVAEEGCKIFFAVMFTS
jgi:hypothetical protein